MRKFFGFTAMLVGVAWGAEPEGNLALKGLDPVELVAGREVKGDPARVIERGRFRYAFATELNRKAFEADPARYGIQFGGACMRMGPLSGGGDPGRFLVHDNRIYVFASDACRDRFRADPSRFVDRADEAPKVAPQDAAKLEALLRKAVEGVGGEAVLKGLKSLQFEFDVALKQGDQEYKSTRIVATTFPMSHAELDDYGTSKYRWLVDSRAGYLTWNSAQPVDESVREYMVREVYRDPVAILKAWRNGEAIARYVGPGKVGDASVEEIALGVHGATTTLSIDPTSGTIRRASFRGRAGGAISDLAREYSDFRVVNGLRVPFTVKSLVGGKAATNPAVTVTAVRVNGELDPKLFAKP